MKFVRKILNNKGLLAIADQGIFSGTNFLTTIMLAHSMLAADFGSLAGITLTVYLFISGSNAIIIQPFQIMIVKVLNKRRYIDFSIQLQIAVILILSFLVFFGSNLFSGHEVLPAAILFGASLLMYDAFRKIFLAMDEPLKALLIDSITSVVQFGGVLVLILTDRPGLNNTLLVLASSYLVGVSVGWLIAKPLFRVNWVLWDEWINEHISQGKWLLITSAVQWGAANLFVLASGLYLGPAALGSFRVVQSLFGVVNLAFQSYENYMIPKAARKLHVSTEEARKYLVKIGVRGVFVFGMMLSVLSVFAEPVMTLVGGSQYAEYGFVVRGMSALYFVILVGYPVRMAIRILVMNREFFTGYVVAFFFSIAASWALLSRFGLEGAIAGLIINQLIILGVWQYALTRRNFLLWKSFT